MTGFGRGEYRDEKRGVTAEIRSVNHRYCDVSVKMPRKYSFAEEAVKTEVKKKIRRGKVDVFIQMDDLGAADADYQLNTAAAAKYLEKLEELAGTFDLKNEVSLEFLAGVPDIIKTVPAVENEEEISSAITAAVNAAAERHFMMSSAEGEKLVRDILMRGGLIKQEVLEIEKRSPEVVSEYMQKLRSRIEDLIGDAGIEESRILQEAAVFSDKINVTEEIVRLKSHIDQLGQILDAPSEPVGKKLDFLVQEMNREANTIGSKANDIEITRRVLTIKSEIEKIREQVQNIE